MSSPLTSMPPRPMSGVAAGPGTPARLVGCTAPASRASLGCVCENDVLCLNPCIPKSWPGFEMTLRHRSTRYDIRVENPRGVSCGIVHAELNGVVLTGDQTWVPLTDDGATHRVRFVLG